MGMKYFMHLKPDPFCRIREGTKTVEYRLCDEKRSMIRIGDTIIFENLEDGTQVKVVVEDVYKAISFSKLKEQLVSAGVIEEGDFHPAKMKVYYSKEEEERYGVVGIKIRTILP